MTKIEAIERLNQCKGDLAAWMEYGRSMERQLRNAIARAERAEAALAERDKPCVWTTRKRRRGNGTMIEPGCKRDSEDWGFISAMEAYPSRYCPNCGHPIRVAPSDNDLLSPDQEEL